MQRTLTQRYEDTITHFRAWRRWRNAVGYQDMCRINADRLTAQRDERRAELGNWDPAVQMLTAMVLLNQCGVFTYLAQPGSTELLHGDGPDQIEHRAFICTIAGDDKKDWLEDRLWQRGHLDHSTFHVKDEAGHYDMAIFELHDPEDSHKNGSVGSDAIHGIPMVRILRPHEDARRPLYVEVAGRAGGQMTAAEIHRLFPVRPDAAAQLYRGWQFTMHAKHFGDSNLFTTLIADFDARRPGLKLGKQYSLLFFAQGHHLAHFGLPLFDEPIIATDRGVTIPTADGSPAEHPDREGPLNTIGYVVERYSSLSPADLRNLIEASQPWLDALVAGGGRVDLGALRDWFLRDDETNDPDDERPNRAERTAAAELWRKHTEQSC